MPLPEQLAELDRRYRARLEAATDELRRCFEQRLRAATEGLTAALAEVQPGAPESLLDAADFAPLERAARQEGERAALDALLECALAFDLAASQGALLDALLVGARPFAPRVAVLIADRDGARGWASLGYGAALVIFLSISLASCNFPLPFQTPVATSGLSDTVLTQAAATIFAEVNATQTQQALARPTETATLPIPSPVAPTVTQEQPARRPRRAPHIQLPMLLLRSYHLQRFLHLPRSRYTPQR